MTTTYIYTKELDCCGGLEVTVKRTILRDLDHTIPSGFIRYTGVANSVIGEYKALSHRNGNTRQYDINVTTKVGFVRSGSRLGQAAQAIGSIAMPGNISRVRSPLRSAGWRAITPGFPGGGGRGIRRRDRAARCPEGYQYGGRFTDNELSTCGQQLFSIPSVLGATIRALRRGLTPQTGEPIRGQVVTGRSGPDIIQRRSPQIPRVGNENTNKKETATKKLIEAMGNPGVEAKRMVRRDGFQLEPIVSAAVLRTIPDNRDMEGATYLTSLTDLGDMGRDELGLLSNTGVTNITYVLPDGSSASIKKVRPLTVGERRKLGRTVNAAIKMDNDKDPAARLKFVSEETGDGISYKEDLKQGTRSLRDALSKASSRKGKQTIADAIREQEEPAKIGSVDDAVAHINGGGSLSDIKPSILQEALKGAAAFKKRPGGILEAENGNRYWVRPSASDYEHLNASIAADIQRHLGIPSSGVAFVGKGGKRRRYVVDAPNLDSTRTLSDAVPADVARMLLADLIANIDQRTPGKIAPVGDRMVPTVTPSELVDLDKIKIRERTEEAIAGMRPLAGETMYSSYYQELREAQRQVFREELDRLLQRARTFNFTDYKDRLYRDGELSQAEKTHLNIIQKIVEGRLDVLTTSHAAILERLENAR